jgi:hypothetical protein
MPDGSDKTLRVDGRFDVLHEPNEVWGPHKRRTSWSFVFSAHNEIIVIISASSVVFLERLSESMSSVAACFASVLSVKRTLSCKTEDKTLRVDQPLQIVVLQRPLLSSSVSLDLGVDRKWHYKVKAGHQVKNGNVFRQSKLIY